MNYGWSPCESCPTAIDVVGGKRNFKNLIEIVRTHIFASHVTLSGCTSLWRNRFESNFPPNFPTRAKEIALNTTDYSFGGNLHVTLCNFVHCANFKGEKEVEVFWWEYKNVKSRLRSYLCWWLIIIHKFHPWRRFYLSCQTFYFDSTQVHQSPAGNFFHKLQNLTLKFHYIVYRRIFLLVIQSTRATREEDKNVDKLTCNNRNSSP